MAATTSATVYGVKRGTNWLTKAGAQIEHSYRVKFRPVHARRMLWGVAADAQKWAADHGTAVEPVTFTATA